jgi:nitric-oxide synthase
VFTDSSVESDPLRRRLRRISLGERIEEARAFIDLFYRENDLPDDQRQARKRAVVRALRRQGFYDHTLDELAYGARVAWRNNAKCIGRLVWKSLEVRDCRAIVEPDSIAAHLAEHLSLALGEGRVRPVISIFAPVRGRESPWYVENSQVTQFAGYVGDDNRVIGDPINVEFTRTAMALGWRPKGEPGAFDLLPLIVRDAGGRRLVYELPEAVHRMVDIRHPDCEAFNGLGLRWYAVPVVSDMILTIGGVDYPCAPFNGYYLGTEIASRDLVDETRYNLLESVGRVIGADPGDVLWKDAALLELNRAVLHSFRAAGVTIVDHHTASAQYLDFVQHEHMAGRTPSGDWSWIVPPQASSACPVFHLPMTDFNDVPNFYRSRASDGGGLAHSRVTEQRGRVQRRVDRVRRRVRNWWRNRYQ